MSEYFLGEIRAVGFNFAPNGWFKCEGQLLPISQYTALFSLLGTQYGGNGTINFALPDLRGRVAVGVNSPFGSIGDVPGSESGSEGVSLVQTELPDHTHAMVASTLAGTSNDPTAGFIAEPAFNTRANQLYAADSGHDHASPQFVAPEGQGVPHENRQPILAMTYIIAYTGIFPSRG